MSYMLFGRLAMLGQGWSAIPPGLDQPLFDDLGQPVVQRDDGSPTPPLILQTLSAGMLRSPQDPGRTTFDGAGFQSCVTVTAGRVLIWAASSAHGKWAGQIRHRWISDVLVRPSSGRRDRGGVRILFLDPVAPADFSGRQYLDLCPVRKVPPAVLAWDLLRRIAVDRHRWTNPGSPADHQVLEELVAMGPQPAKLPAWYCIPWPSVTAPTTAAPTTGAPTTAPATPPSPVQGPPSSAVVPADSPWAPRRSAVTELPDAISTPPPSAAPVPDPGGSMIVAVPGVGRPAAPAPVGYPAVTSGPVGRIGYRVEMDTGDVFVVDTPTVFGRNPVADPGEDVRLQSVADPSSCC